MSKKRMMLIVVTIMITAILGGVITLFIIGRKIEINTNIKLDGVSEEIGSVLYYASFAANSHNTQPWKIKLDVQKQELIIYMDKERMLKTVDPKNREMYISLGCYIESLTFAFDTYGFDTMVKYSNLMGTSNEIATISYSKRKNSYIKEKQIKTIIRRHTDKRGYRLDSLDKNDISKILANFDNIYYFENDSKEFTYLKNGTLESISKQSSDIAYRDELNLWMRFSNEEVKQKKDGISAEMIELNGIIKALYYLTTNHRNASSDTFAKQGIDTTKKQVENCGGFFVITGGDTTFDWLEIGRKTQAFWYLCVENNIAIQPLSAMLEIEFYKNEINNYLKLKENAQMILRAGYVDDYGENAKVRRDLYEYVTVINSDN